MQMDIDGTVPLNNDMSQLTSMRGGTKKKTVNGMPQHHMTGKHKSLINQIQFSYPHQKNVNKHELKPLDNFFRSIRDEKDWFAFCKLLYLYFEGVLSLKEFITVYDEKFQQKLKQEIKDEMDKLMPTRDINRRNLSSLLKAWNDTENTTFEKVADSSYYRIDEGFPIPTCTMKMTDEVYFGNLNDIYLSLATGSENKKFRNTNEDKIYSIEDKMYEYDT
jgi:histone deacetylase complex regulatory component SIN3